MKLVKRVYGFLSSWRLTFWLVALFVLYYLTTSVWMDEAFARFIHYLSKNNIVRLLYVLFLMNVTLRVFKSLVNLRKSPLRLLIRLPLLMGIVLFLFSSFMSVNTRQLRWQLLGEGDILRLPWEKEVFRVVKITSALKKDLLRMDDSVIFDYEPYITFQDRAGRLHRIGAFPPRRLSETYMHVLNFGLAPGIEFSKDGKSLLRGEVALRLIPFGVVDSFELRGYNYKVFMHIMPNRIIRRGKEVARNYDIRSPLYQIEVLRGDKTVFEGTSSGVVSFDGYELRLYPPSFWVLLEAAYDPFYIPFVVSLGLLLGGGLIYLAGGLIFYLARR